MVEGFFNLTALAAGYKWIPRGSSVAAAAHFRTQDYSRTRPLRKQDFGCLVGFLKVCRAAGIALVWFLKVSEARLAHAHPHGVPAVHAAHTSHTRRVSSY